MDKNTNSMKNLYKIVKYTGIGGNYLLITGNY